MQSGIVESYALGLATSEEVDEFEQLLPHYPELRDALLDFEYHLELFSIDHEIPPPPEIRQRVEARLREAPAMPDPARRQYRRHGPEYMEVKETSDHIRVHKVWRKLFIALVVLAKILLALAIFYFLEYRHAEKQLDHSPAPSAKQN
jgi:anti-sigma-K factor RskA